MVVFKVGHPNLEKTHSKAILTFLNNSKIQLKTKIKDSKTQKEKSKISSRKYQ